MLALALAAYAPERAGHTLTDNAEERHALEVGSQIRCAVCQGMSVADSPAPMAQAMMDRIRDQVHDGKTDAEIRDYFVQRYGEWILLSPPRHGFNWFVWLSPLALVVGGLWLLLRPPGRVVKSAEKSDTTPGADRSRYLDAVRREVEK